ncbi:hypothetical protein IMZ48_26210 [Candidatus Bathyarchaeota archaeon]|nr:hypothetical protein [Candidatus Bathyarchaeota archaeon]
MMFRDAETLKQYQLARERGEPEPSPAEMNKRVDAAIAERNQKPFLVGGTAGQVLAGNQIPLSPAKGFLEKAADVVGGVGGAIANIGLTRRILPTAPEPLVWEVATEAAGGTPGTGAAMAGIMAGAGKIVGKSPAAESIGKRVLRRAEKAGIESAGFGGLAVAEGGTWEEIATGMLIPLTLASIGAMKELPVEARRLKLKKGAQQTAEAEKTMPQEAVVAAERLIDSSAYDDLGVSSAGARVKPRIRAEAGLGREVVPAQEPLPVSDAAQKPPLTQEQGKAAEIKDAFSAESLHGAVSESFARDAFDRLSAGKSLLFPNAKPEKSVTAAWQRGEIKSADDVLRIMQTALGEPVSQKTTAVSGSVPPAEPQATPISSAVSGKFPRPKELTEPLPGTWTVISELSDQELQARLVSATPWRAYYRQEVAIRQQERVGIELPPPAEPMGTTTATGEPSIRNAYMEAEQIRMGGLPLPASRQHTSFKELERQAVASGEVSLVDTKAADILQHPRNLSGLENVAFDMRRRQLASEFDQLGNIAEGLPDGPQRRDLRDKQASLQEQHRNIAEATKLAAGYEWGLTGRTRQEARRIEQDVTDTPAMLDQAEIKKGSVLTEPERADVTAKVRVTREATEARDARQRVVSKNRAQRSTRLGKRRYRGMTEAEKDAEVQQTLKDITLDNRDASIKRIVENLASRPGAGDFDAVAKRMQKMLPDATVESVADSIVNAIQRKIRNTDDLIATINEIASRQPRRNNKLREAIADLRYYLERGEAKEPRERAPKTEIEANQKLIEIRDQLKAEYKDSDPVVAQRLQEQLDLLNARIANGDYGPKTKAEARVRSPEVEHLAYEVAKRRQELAQRMMKFRAPPKTWQGKVLHTYLPTIPKSLRVIQAWKSSVDLPLLRQGGIAMRSHPLRTLRRVPEAIQAMFNPETAFRINDEIINGENSWWYHRAGVDFSSTGGAMTAREELFASEWAERIYGVGRVVRASDRGFVTLLNMIRADSFDAMTRGFTKDGGSLPEAQAIAAYVNVMTGRGSIELIQKHAPILNGWLWSPKFAASRFQFLVGMPIWQAPTWRTRGIILEEYGRYLAGVAVTGWLYETVFGGKTETDLRSTDFMKQVVGDVRLDPLSGLSQSLVFLAREFTGQTKTAKGDVVPLNASDPDYPHKGDTRVTIAERYLRGKLGYGPGLFWDRAVGKDFKGHPFSWVAAIGNMLVPMSMEDLVGVMQNQGVPKGLAMQTLSTLSEGVQVHEPSAPKGLIRKGLARKVLRRKVP